MTLGSDNIHKLSVMSFYTIGAFENKFNSERSALYFEGIRKMNPSYVPISVSTKNLKSLFDLLTNLCSPPKSMYLGLNRILNFEP